MIGDSWIVPSSASSVGGLTLHCVSTVATDSAFKVSVNQATRDSAYSQHGGGRGFLAIRTTNGRGQVDLTSNHLLDVGANSLLIIDWASLLGYRCLGGHWDFWWFDFSLREPLDLPLDEVVLAPIQPDECRIYESLVGNLRDTSAANRRLACAQFQMMLCQWRSEIGDYDTESNQHQLVRSVISEMYNRLDGSFKVCQMAAMAELSESHFRRLFQAITGRSPKKHYDQLRLAWADHNLSTGRLNVTEVADQLGFSSPFHFSRIFRQHFGCPPSDRKPKRTRLMRVNGRGG